MTITVDRLDATTFRVTVGQETTTTHTVAVRTEDWQRLTGGRVPAETLVEKSFEFLLEREPNTSILRKFDLMVIQQYFPNYENAIRKMLKPG